MSTQDSVNPELNPEAVASTKQEIRGLVSEIAQLSKSDIGPQEFYGALLDRVVSALAAIGGAVWTINDEGHLELQYQMGMHKTDLASSPESQQQHTRLLAHSLQADEGLLIPPHATGVTEDGAGNPTEFLLILGPLMSDAKRYGAIEIFQRPGSSATTQRGYLRFLLQMCELASGFLKSRELRHYADRQTLWSQLEQYTQTAHKSLDPIQTAYTIANEGRRLIDCDRVSVAIRKGRRCRIEAVSGQDTFDRRATSVTQLGDLAKLTIATGDPIWYTGDTSNMAPQVEDAIHEYVDESHTKAMGILPLMIEVSEDDEEASQKRPEPFGAIIVEQIDQAHVTESMQQRVEMVRSHGAIALENSMKHDGIFLMPLWRTIGKSKWLIEAKTLPKTVSISAAVLILLLVLFLVPIGFELSADGALQPGERENVFASMAGEVTEVYKGHDEIVVAGDPLVRLENHQLEERIAQIVGEIGKKQEGYRDLHLRRQGKSLSNDEKAQIIGQIAPLEKSLDSLREQLRILRVQDEQLLMRSPINGKVTNYDVKRTLIRQQVQQGDIVMNIANPDKEWELEILMPENKIGHVVRYLEANDKDETELEVIYILATNPGVKFPGKVVEIQKIAEVRGEEGNTVLIRVKLDETNKPSTAELRPGASVTAKIRCGSASIGYVWFHDVVDFVRAKILFRL